MDLSRSNTVYFLGIGGIGMSALARYFLHLGKNIFGYDLTSTPLTHQLENEGMVIHYSEDIDCIPANIDLAIYTPAIPSKNAELVYLKNNEVPLFKRSEITGIISKEYFTIAFAGTHGKTSITALTAKMLKSAGKNITALIGGILSSEKTNFISSPTTEMFLIEADEFDHSFLQLNPNIGVISSIDADHLDIYKDKSDLHTSFLQFAKQIKPDGTLYLNDNIKSFNSPAPNTLTYGLSNLAEVKALNVRVENAHFVFDLNYEGRLIAGIKMNIPGHHYVENACAAAAIGIQLGLSEQEIKYGLEDFQGVERRFEIRVKSGKTIYIDDYAHHPEEIKATLRAIKTLYPRKKITAVFQPHLFSRTNDFFNEFAKELSAIDEVFLMPIYPAREEPMSGISSKLIFDKISIPNKTLLRSKTELLEEITKTNTDVLVSLGAGDIGLLVPEIEKILTNK